MANPTTTISTSRATTTTSRAITQPSRKRHKVSNDDDDHHQSLLPGLPDHIAHLCLSLISPTTLYSVCRSWRRLLYSATFPPFRSLYILSLPTTATTIPARATTTACATAAARATTAASTTTGGGGQILTLSSYDPISSKWITTTSPPLPPFHHRQPSLISRSLPIQSLTVSGNLVLIAATSGHRNIPFPAFSHPIIFNPLTNTWFSGPPFSTPRRWCAAGAFQETVVVASGIGSHYTESVARSVEKWVVRKIESFDQKRRGFDGSWKKNESLMIPEIKTESFDEKRNGNCKKIQSLRFSELKGESFDEKRNMNGEKILSLKCSELKSESLNENHIRHYENIQSLKYSEVKTELARNSKIQFLAPKNSKIESFHNSHFTSHQKLQSLKFSELKTESFNKKQSWNCEKIQSLTTPKLKPESFDKKQLGNYEKIQSLTTLELKTESFDGKQHGKWIKMQSLKNSKLCREPIEAVGWKGKLCMVNVKGDYTKEGFVYNINSDEWAEMPIGMLGGWRGPVAAMEEETMYVVDETRGVLSTYNEDIDKWLEVVVDERLKGAEYMAANGGKVCVVCENHVGIVVVDVAVTPPRLWVVETSPGHEILGVYILPRMGLQPEF